MNDIGALEELIAALDRRVPQVHRAGEEIIARESAALRALAVNRLAELVGTFGGSEDRPARLCSCLVR